MRRNLLAVKGSIGLIGHESVEYMKMKTHIVFLHGYGANKEDLMPLGPMLKTHERQHFHFFDAPVVLTEMSFSTFKARAWFALSLSQMNRIMGPGDVDLSSEIPPDLNNALNSIDQQLASLQIAPEDELIIGGFSQGAMCALHYFSKNFEKYNFKKLVLLSGHLVGKTLLFAKEPPKIPVYQSHGTNDQVLPYSGAENLLRFLEGHQFKVQFESFMGGHEIPPIILQQLRKFL